MKCKSARNKRRTIKKVGNDDNGSISSFSSLSRSASSPSISSSHDAAVAVVPPSSANPKPSAVPASAAAVSSPSAIPAWAAAVSSSSAPILPRRAIGGSKFHERLGFVQLELAVSNRSKCRLCTSLIARGHLRAEYACHTHKPSGHAHVDCVSVRKDKLRLQDTGLTKETLVRAMDEPNMLEWRGNVQTAIDSLT